MNESLHRNQLNSVQDAGLSKADTWCWLRWCSIGTFYRKIMLTKPTKNSSLQDLFELPEYIMVPEYGLRAILLLVSFSGLFRTKVNRPQSPGLDH